MHDFVFPFRSAAILVILHTPDNWAVTDKQVVTHSWRWFSANRRLGREFYEISLLFGDSAKAEAAIGIGRSGEATTVGVLALR
jgi:hypothetical protein